MKCIEILDLQKERYVCMYVCMYIYIYTYIYISLILQIENFNTFHVIYVIHIHTYHDYYKYKHIYRESKRFLEIRIDNI